MEERVQPVRRPRGRPRQFDPDAALEAAMEVFWSRGFAATSVDDLANAMGMNRPSIANAFGNKEALYHQALALFDQRMKTEVGEQLIGDPDLAGALTAFFYSALDVYFSSDAAPGCFVMCTAPAEAGEHPAVRNFLKRLIGEVDDILAARFRQAIQDGDFSPNANPKSSAQLTQAILHSLAIRARAGESKASLRRMAREAVETVLRSSEPR